MRDIQFALVREGPSDDGLAILIRALLGRSGVPGVIGAARNYQGTTKTKLAQVLNEDVVPDLIFVHRDSDSRDATGRHDEITSAAIELGCQDKVVAVVPVQETESWLLTDESAIRTVVGRPKGRTPRSSPGAWCTTSLCDSSTGWVRRSVPPGWPPVRVMGWGRYGIC